MYDKCKFVDKEPIIWSSHIEKSVYKKFWNNISFVEAPFVDSVSIFYFSEHNITIKKTIKN